VAPTGLPWWRVPIAWAASSITRSPWSAAIRRPRPADQPGEVAHHDRPGALADQLRQLVGSTVSVGSSMSQKTTSAPVAVIAWRAAT
jgi:hypothetical protein